MITRRNVIDDDCTSEDSHSIDDRHEPLLDSTTVRDLWRIVTAKTQMPPPADRQDPAWADAWSCFETVYGPALKAYVYRILRRAGCGT
ncbi:MAG: hypothetical protein ACYTG6_14750, partial [Planctomycetota bacterium]